MITPRDYQKEAIQAIFKYFYSGKRGNPLVVAPTGSGKSIMISYLCSEVVKRWPGQKILVISHVRKILGQNYSAIKKHIKNKEIGLYSAGLKSKTIKDITVAGIQSIYNKPELFDQFDIIIVDECHTIPHKRNGMYHKFFNQIEKPVIGFTATPFRLGYGYLHLGDGAFFDDIVYTITIKKLQADGYLCSLTCKGTKKRLKADKIKKVAGDFMLKELSLAFDREEITKDIVQELLIYKQLRKKWLVFAIDIEHAEHLAKQLCLNGIKAAAVHSKMNGDEDAIYKGFEEDEYQALVSVAMLTTGFDAPYVDLIALCRPTDSPVLHIQIIGRGLRIFPGKDDCLILDFANNLLRNGPIDSPVIKIKGNGTGEAIMKECNNCWEIVHAAVRICPSCGQAFQFKHKLSATPKERKVLTFEEWHKVTEVKYFRYTGSKGIPMLKVSYFCGLRRFSEFVCLEHNGYAQHKAKHWWKRRSKVEAPSTAQQALEHSSTLTQPKEILVNEGGKFDTIKDMRF